jgi:hypothetical protein
LPRDAVWLTGHAFLALAVARVGDSERAEHLYRLLLPYVDRPVLVGAGGAIWGPVALYLGALAATFGDTERAGRHFNDATAWYTAAGATPWLALVDAVRGAVRATPTTKPGAPQPA